MKDPRNKQRLANVLAVPLAVGMLGKAIATAIWGSMKADPWGWIAVGSGIALFHIGEELTAFAVMTFVATFGLLLSYEKQQLIDKQSDLLRRFTEAASGVVRTATSLGLLQSMKAGEHSAKQADFEKHRLN